MRPSVIPGIQCVLNVPIERPSAATAFGIKKTHDSEADVKQRKLICKMQMTN